MRDHAVAGREDGRARVGRDVHAVVVAAPPLAKTGAALHNTFYLIALLLIDPFFISFSLLLFSLHFFSFLPSLRACVALALCFLY